VSIGFRPLERDANRITKSELLEISLVAIPANPAAVVTDVRGGASPEKPWHELTFKERHELFERDPLGAMARRAAVPTHAGKTWAELSNDERVALYKVNRSLFFEMMNRAIDDNDAA